MEKIMKIKIVADSSANLYTLDGPDFDFSPVPLKVLAGDREYVDDSRLDVPQMLKELKEYKGKSSTACPSVGDWLEAFGDADIVYGSAITSHLSGCYNAAAIAAEHKGTLKAESDAASTRFIFTMPLLKK